MILVSCSYIPLELPLAAGSPAKRLFFPSSLSPVDTDGLLPRDFCPYARAFMREYDPDDILIVAGSCDAMRRTYDAARYWNLAADTFYLDVPRTVDEGSVSYFASQLRELAADIGNVSPAGQVGESSLRLACEAMNMVRNAMAEAAGFMERGEWPASRMLQTALNVNEVVSDVSLWGETRNNEEGFDRKIRDALVGAVCAEIDEAVSDGGQGGGPPGLVRVGVSGTCLLDLSLIECLEEADLDVVFIDSCMAQRMYDFSVDIEPDGDIYEALARSYLSKPACPRMFVGYDRISRLNDLAFKHGAMGLIYFAPKFCDLGYYEFPEVKKGLRETSGLPCLLLEGEYGAGKTGQALTRVVAFREMLEGRRELNEV